jgi:hypothetical protein
MTKCYNAFFDFTKGMLCRGCDSNYNNFVTKNESTGKLNIKFTTNTCDKLWKKCEVYINEANELPDIFSESRKFI